MPNNTGGADNFADDVNARTEQLMADIRAAADGYIVRPDRLVAATNLIYVMELAVLISDDVMWGAFKSALGSHTATYSREAKAALANDLRTLHTAIKAEWSASRNRQRESARDNTPGEAPGPVQNRVLPKGMVASENPLSVVLPPSIDDINNIVIRILRSSHNVGTQILSNGVDLMANLLSSERVGEAPSYKLQRAGRELVFNLLLSECSFMRETESGEVSAMPPTDVIAGVLRSLITQAPRLRTKTAIPWLHGDHLVTTQGYHRGTGVWFQTPVPEQVHTFPADPTEAERDAAVEVVKEIYLGGFKPATAADGANILGTALMTVIQPASPDRSPMVLVSKPEQNSGGSWAARILTMTGIGADPDVENWPEDDEEEQRKMLFSSLREQPAAKMYDNVKGTLEGSALAIAAEARIIHGRVLGTSTSVSFTINCQIIFAGNGVTLDRDMIRRTNFINLEAFATDAERAEARRGRASTEPLWLQLNHRRAVEALLTMVSRWLKHGMPRGKTLDSYESTTGIVGGILESCGVSGWLDNRAGDTFEMLGDRELTEQDFVRSLWRVFGATPFTCTEVIEADFDGGPLELPIRTNDQPSPAQRNRRLGQWFRARLNRYFDVVEGHPASPAGPARGSLPPTLPMPAVERVRAKFVKNRTNNARMYYFETVGDLI